ncbi:MAG TPA: serine/threonine-protein kinase [Kofleriaceae bacterium]|nr:serine/threonine-protein kinase [Kofleriaceae bacterium]
MVRHSSSVGSVEVPSKSPHDDDDLDPGRWEATHYADGEPLGEGGWGIVRPVRHLASGERRALKQPLRLDDEVCARFKREIEVQRKLRHPHVMPVLGHDLDHRWFTMPLADRTLQSAAPGMCHEELARTVIHAASGLREAHKLGYIHRDVKPSNILELSRNDLHSPYWVVGDFGIVRRPDHEITELKTRRALGTEGYMAPEALLGKHAKVTHLADVYSLGRTIAWATTGIRPEGLSPLEAAWPWTELVARMTAERPADRPSGMLEVIAGVEEIIAVLRASRARQWGKAAGAAAMMASMAAPLAAPLASLTARDELLLAHVFELASPVHDHDDLRITQGMRSCRLANQAVVRIGLRRLIQLGYLAPAWLGGESGRERAYAPTQQAWDWATSNHDRIAGLLARAPAALVPAEVQALPAASPPAPIPSQAPSQAPSRAQSMTGEVPF